MARKRWGRGGSGPEDVGQPGGVAVLEVDVVGFGEDIVEVEHEICVTALTEGAEVGICREAGLEKDFMSCIDSCMASVDIDPATYDPADSSTSPVANCVGGCFSSTSCQ